MKRNIAAQYVFTNCGEPLRNGVVSVDDETGTILSINELNSEIANTEHYNGVIVPGFVNAHCHLELSHLKGLIPKCPHLIDFLEKISHFQRSLQFSSDECKSADNLMYINGIQAVGDISNNANSALVKLESKIHYRNFIELIGGSKENVEKACNTFKKVTNEFRSILGDLSLTACPHAPYSVAPELFEAINNFNDFSIISIHNQETESENNLYIDKTGSLAERFPMDISAIKPTGMRSLASYIHHLVSYDNVLLVHNTFSNSEDFALALNKLKNPYFVLCPKSNLYLENTLPDVDTMRKLNLNICLGTDSLSSNNTLSILEEMKVMIKNFKDLPFAEVLKYATINGAKALKFDDFLGSISVGKRPGLLLIKNFDFQNMSISDDSYIERITV